jgi:hypothetical protein
VVDGVLFLNKMHEKYELEAIREQWLVNLPFMSKDNFISLEDYYYGVHPEKLKDICNKTNEEILKESEEILAKVENKKG